MPQNDMLLSRDERKARRDEERAARLAARNARRPNDPPATPVADPDAPSPQETALNAFYGTQLYQFPLEQGLQAVNANWAGRGMLESGAAEKSMNDYAAGMASGGMRDYMGWLGNQQSLGATAASSAAGIGANYGNTMAGINNNYANAMQGLNSGYASGVSGISNNMANAQSNYATNVGNITSNAAIARANNTNSMISGIGNALGYGLGALAYGGGGGGGGGLGTALPAATSTWPGYGLNTSFA